MRAHGTLVEASDAVPRGIPGLPYPGIYTGASFTDPIMLKDAAGMPVRNWTA